MPLPKPTEAQRRALLKDALSPLAENERVLLFDALDALFESVLTDDALLHEDVDQNEAAGAADASRGVRGEAFGFGEE